MELVNPHSSFIWHAPLDVNGVPMMGIPEKQGVAFSRAGYLAAKKDPTIKADEYGAELRKGLRPLSRKTLLKARDSYRGLQVPEFPYYFIIEPVNVCNRKCPFCSINVMTRYDTDGSKVQGVMPYPVFKQLMDECAQYDVYGMSLYQLGEPFFWHGKDVNGKKLDVADLVNATKDIGGFQAVNLSTNGDVKNLDSILGSQLDDLIISIDGTTKEIYEENRPGVTARDTFERTIERVRAFLENKATRGHVAPFVRLQIINKDNTRDQVLGFIRQWIEIPGVDDILVKHLDSMRSWLGDKVVTDEEEQIKAKRVEHMPCQHLYSIGSMVVNGDLNACCHDARTELVQKQRGAGGLTRNANILQTSFFDWWHGVFMTQLRCEHESQIFRLPCRECRERDVWLG